MTADQVAQIVNMIAEKLGVAAEKVYPMLVQQAKVHCGVVSVGLWVFGIALVLFILSIIGACASDFDSNLCGLSILGIFVFGLVMAIACIYLMCNLNSYVTAIYNPEWWAIEYVVKLLN